MKTLTTTNAKNLIGKTINWKAPSNECNKPYSGVAVVNSLDNLKLEATIISGDNLNFAFLDRTMQGNLLSTEYYFSDVDRCVYFELVNN